MIPEAMQGATEFEIYVFLHQGNRTIGQIKRLWGKTTDDVRNAMDKAIRLKWSAIPLNELPQIPDDGLGLERVAEYRDAESYVAQNYKKVGSRTSPEKLQAIKDALAAGWSCRRISKELHACERTVAKVKHGGFDV